MVCGNRTLSSHVATLLKRQFGESRFRSDIDASVVAAYEAAIQSSFLGDIGHFIGAKFAGDVGIFLYTVDGVSTLNAGHTAQDDMIVAVDTNSEARFVLAADRGLICVTSRAKLMRWLDVLAATEVSTTTGYGEGRKMSYATGGARDVQEVITDKQLTEIIGEASMAALQDIFAATDVWQHNVVTLCRVEAVPGNRYHGRSSGLIGWHTDFVRRTLQVALNDDDEYEGGRLVYGTTSGLCIPQRQAGCASLHGSSIAHGVSEMLDGCRYGLFLLDTRIEIEIRQVGTVSIN
eukprot:CAMPEP_0197445092 /NCGR_PEP_ID=MMETSP1175-20131217/10397_1 /TAXON_ID=1003142 /ORGANISM="Triceratium dubium, Strain CCMP147" /LENGTH=290 /DNA_ID=CAMNT_0042975995 /DNA_START=204 /DNA_END=1073 /DNA_ORIENTATION=+